MKLFKDIVPTGLRYFEKWPETDIFNGIHRVRYTGGENTDLRVMIFHVQLVHDVLQCTILGKSLVAASVHLGERYDLMEKCHVRSTTGTTRSKKLVAIYACLPTAEMVTKMVTDYRAKTTDSYEECLHIIGTLLVEAAEVCKAKGSTYRIAVGQDLIDPSSPFFSERFITIYQAHEEEVFLDPEAVT